MLLLIKSVGTTSFLKKQNPCTAQIYAQHNEVPRKDQMEKTTENSTTQRMAWAVLSRSVNGRSEVIKVTDHEDADQTVQDYPDLFYKSGPFVLA
jgi:hypothetical protein